MKNTFFVGYLEDITWQPKQITQLNGQMAAVFAWLLLEPALGPVWE
jgi:hypothetical protein